MRRPVNPPLRRCVRLHGSEPGLSAVAGATELALDSIRAYLSPRLTASTGGRCAGDCPAALIRLHALHALRPGCRCRSHVRRPLVVHTDGGSVYIGGEWAEACDAGTSLGPCCAKPGAPARRGARGSSAPEGQLLRLGAGPARGTRSSREGSAITSSGAGAASSRSR